MIKSYLYANRLFNDCNKVTSIFDKKQVIYDNDGSCGSKVM